jgi:hypothetical protein
MYAPILKYKGAVSGNLESDIASDNLDAIELAIGIQNENTTEYINTTTYDIDDEVMYLGEQFVSLATANTGNNPLDNPDKWMPCLSRTNIIKLWQDGVLQDGGLGAVHNNRDANYRTSFKLGKYNFGGSSGRNFQAYGVHLDGAVVTGDTTLEAVLKVGLTGEYHFLDIIAPDVAGTRSLVDIRKRVERVGDATGGVTENIGGVQNFATQGWQAYAAADDTGARNLYGLTGNRDTTPQTSTLANSTTMRMTTTAQGATNRIKAGNDGTNGDIQTASETRMMNYVVVLKYLIILHEL